MKNNNDDRNIFKESPILLVSSTRIPEKEKQEGLHYYSVRHSDDCAFTPTTVEKRVRVHHMFDIATEQPLDLSGGELELTKEEQKEIFLAMVYGPFICR
ncbi:hypothetical protein JOC94_002306 [Bacillus thermophilus]|uniref:Large polyvalent protein associated domain-containing protein n=1 Tax=Siminovitchia thermophila TaxID=1245522 RepID=A0ABS2R6U0_9BACI|nr:LPD28 domain-containing protein [Siminovitchia thermophila]MBM7715319.1 hypothetical protein [Siminovitchia thermophila]